MARKQADYNIHNYVQDTQEGFDTKPFNEVDGLVLTQVSNMNFDGLGIDIHSGNPKTIEQIYNEMCIEGSAANDVYNKMGSDERKLLQEMATSDRYKNMSLSNYVNNPAKTGVEGFNAVNDNDVSMEQFAAVTITYEQNGETYNYMSFQATNNTTDGWTEDFAMLARENTQAQQDSVYYMNIVGPQLEGHIVGGGHSKGGNDFEYGYLFCDEEVRQRIEKGYIYDSPGLTDEVLATTDRYDDFQQIIEDTYICPQDSVIGQLLHQNDNPTFIHSVESGVNEHDPYSWVIDPSTGTFQPDEQTEFSILINEATDTAVAGMSQEQREALFEFVHYLMYNNGGESLDGIMDLFGEGWDNPQNKINEIWTVISGAWNSMSEEERKKFLESLGVLISAVIVVGGGYVIEKIDEWIDEKIKQIKEKIEYMKDVAIYWKERIQKQFRDFLDNVYKAVEINIRKLATLIKSISSAYRYATANPQITVDTYKLDSYSQRLRRVNTRISRLDSRLDSLYWQVGLLDLWNLMQADLMTGYSWRLLRCANYLSDTSTDFKKIENDLAAKIQ